MLILISDRTKEVQPQSGGFIILSFCVSGRPGGIFERHREFKERHQQITNELQKKSKENNKKPYFKPESSPPRRAVLVRVAQNKQRINTSKSTKRN